MKTEVDFQQAANDYAKIAIENIREMVLAMEHAAECDGEMECDQCAGTGEIDSETPCDTCESKGVVPCTEGHDSDSPEDWHDEDEARQRIQEDALSVEVRGDWHTPGDDDGNAPTEYAILLTTGGPAARIVGDLTNFGEPKSARFEYQDWFKPWTEANTSSSDDAVMLQYAQQFYFGEGQ